MIQQVHPFPARMAPDLALKTLNALSSGSRVLDPMMGSGTVVRQASDLGHSAVGFDMDPLAVLMSRVWTTPVADDQIERLGRDVIAEARMLKASDVALPWMDGDTETEAFTAFWFANQQRTALRRLAHVLYDLNSRGLSEGDAAAADVLRIALSRIIVTKEQAASLARDTSHSRPHRVSLTSDFDVMAGMERSLGVVRKRLMASPPVSGSTVSQGDARRLDEVADNSVDAVLTSPPYLNAIDYMRGHRLSLVWLGHKLSDLRGVRSTSIGAEKKPDEVEEPAWAAEILESMGAVGELPRRYRAMISRYAYDLYAMLQEVSRVLKPTGSATFVMGNSCLKGVFIRNSSAVATAAALHGLTLKDEYERPLPERSRYLPVGAGSALEKRMRTETILAFAS